MSFRAIKNVKGKYDLIAVLGYGFTSDWKLPQHSVSALKLAANLYHQKVAPKIAVCGKWSRTWDEIDVTPPTTEAQEMKKYLITLDIKPDDIFIENQSKDTIGNIYYLKTKIVIPRNIKSIICICADYHLGKVRYVLDKMFEKFYTIDILTTHTNASNDLKAAQKLRVAAFKNFLRKMKKGDASYLDDKLYSDPFFQKKLPEIISKTTKGDLQ